MEMIDVLDESGKVTGVIKTKQQIYDDGDWHRTVHIWIVNNNKEILVQKRNPNKKTYPNLWALSAAGHVDAGETSLTAGMRELKEELGLEICENEMKFLFSIKEERPYKDRFIKTIDDVYLIEKEIDVNNTKLQFEELTDIKYVYYEYLNSIFKNNDGDYVPYNEEHEKLFDFLDDKFCEVI